MSSDSVEQLVIEHSAARREAVCLRGDQAGYLLCFAAQDGSLRNDYWFESLEDAEQAAAEEFGVKSEQWMTIH